MADGGGGPKTGRMRLLLSLLAVMAAAITVEAADPAIPSPYNDDRTFVDPIAAAEALGIPPRAVSGSRCRITWSWRT